MILINEPCLSSTFDDSSMTPVNVVLTVKHRVAFDDAKIVIHEFDQAVEDEAHKVELWYSDREYHLIKMMNRIIVKAVCRGSFKESNIHTSRGLERYWNDSHSRWLYVAAALKTQESQYRQGFHHPELLAYKCISVSQRSKNAALILAKQDALELQDS